MNTLLFTTTNQGKMQEMRALFEGSKVQLLMPNALGIQLDVAESGETYAENAALKARAWAAASGLPTLADDSGLEVEHLDWQPGVQSARFHPKKGATDAERRTYLLQLLQAFPQPWAARFVCVLCLAQPNGEVDYSRGECPGIIITEERGENGFGYDPIFYIPELGKTMAELSMEEKNRISHRARATHHKWTKMISL